MYIGMELVGVDAGSVDPRAASMERHTHKLVSPRQDSFEGATPIVQLVPQKNPIEAELSDTINLLAAQFRHVTFEGLTASPRDPHQARRAFTHIGRGREDRL
jgi:hypothetical protein